MNHHATRAAGLLLLALLLCAGAPAGAVELHVDFGVNDEPFEGGFFPTPNDVQAGFFDFSADQNAADDDGEIARLDLAGTSRLVSGVTVSLGIVPAGSEDHPPELFLMDSTGEGAGGLGDLIEDVAAALSGDLTIALSGLPAGAYQWTSYHHMPQLEFNWLGSFDIYAGGGPIPKVSGLFPTSGFNSAAEASFTFTVNGSGNVVLRLHSNDSLPSVVFLNGFSLMPIPEPSTWILFAIGWFAIAAQRFGAARLQR